MSIVLDASMTIAWLFEDEQTEGAHAALRRVVAEGAIVPSLWRPEVANVLRNAVRKRRCDEAYVDSSLTRLDRLSVTIDHETDEHAWGATRALSREEGLTPYDAAYLELALRTEASLASGDEELMAAALRRGVEVMAL
ncbi:MAG: type II toxin-antitoxin system VapC family toxin [Sphingomonas sp.]